MIGVPRVLVISGSMGAGKTTVMGEASDLLSARGVVHAAFDLDALGIVLLPEPVAAELHYRNLAAIYTNSVEAGVESFLIAAAIESREVLNDLLVKTRDGKLRWRQNQEDDFTVALPGYSIHILTDHLSEEFDGVIPIWAHFRDDRAVTILTVEANPVTAKDDYALLSSVLAAARIQVVGRSLKGLKEALATV